MATECGMYETSWQDIQAWASVTGAKLSAWEAAAIRRICMSYTSAVNEYRCKDVPAPWSAGVIDIEAVANKARLAFRGKKRG